MNRLAILLFVFFFLSSFNLVAKNLPSWYPSQFQYTGTIEIKITDQRNVVVNDQNYQVSQSVQIHQTKQQFNPYSTLKVGQQIGFNVSDPSLGTPIITEIWILPKSYKIVNEE